MVFRGKPSAGCESCRKAKKRCTLEQPACARCVKLKKPCSGYRDTTQLQIQDETEEVRARANRQRVRQATPLNYSRIAPSSARKDASIGVLTPALTHAGSASSSDDIYDLSVGEHVIDFSVDETANDFNQPEDPSWSLAPLPKPIKPSADDVASTYFFKEFTSPYHWNYLRGWASSNHFDPCLDLAIRACGMAALYNVENVVMGSQYARRMYVDALGLLNTALRDPQKCRTDESLIAVAMLGYFENLTCDSRESIQSWKAHMAGATQLLKLRGQAQFKTDTGRLIFRETRGNILIHCIWDDLDPPDFMWEWQEELARQTPAWYAGIIEPADELTRISFIFAKFRANIAKGRITDQAGAEVCADIDRQMIQWSVNAMNGHPIWQYYDLEVPDSPHVWNGMVHAYAQTPAPSVWNTYRAIRILVTRSQEMLCRRLQARFTDTERKEQTAYFRRVRRQMTDEVCAGVPSMLGHAHPAFNSPCTLVSAYGLIWPLFFAGTCALERIGPTASWEIAATLSSQPHAGQQKTSAAAAQLAWVLGRLEYISRMVGLRWAEGIAAVLRGDFRLHMDLSPENSDGVVWDQGLHVAQCESGLPHPRTLEIESSATKDPQPGKGPIWTGEKGGTSIRPV